MMQLSYGVLISGVWFILQVLNQIVYELPAEHPLAESRPLRELLGHTPPQVMLLHLILTIMYLEAF